MTGPEEDQDATRLTPSELVRDHAGRFLGDLRANLSPNLLLEGV